MSKLKTAFPGAVQGITERSNLIVDGVMVAGLSGLALAFGTAVLPFAAGAVIGALSFDAIKGAAHALKGPA